MSKFVTMMTVVTFAVVMAMAVASCDSTIHFYPEPETGNEHVAKPRIDIDWSGYHKDVPTGVTVVCHCVATGKRTNTIDNNIDYVFPALDHQRHWTTAYNLTENEFNYIAFRGFEAYDTEEAYVREISSPAWYKARSSSYLAGQPEWLAVDTIMTVLVEEAIHNTSASFVSIGTLHPKNIIYTLHIKLHTENIGNLISARASISGLANGRLLASEAPNDNSVTVAHIIDPDDWTRSRTDSDNDVGIVKADIRCFGLPSNHIGSADENTLEFQAMLADGKTVMKYVMPVGHLITEGKTPPDKRGDNLDLYLDLWLDPPLPPGGDGDWGLDVWVDDWDAEPDVDIPFHK